MRLKNVFLLSQLLIFTATRIYANHHSSADSEIILANQEDHGPHGGHRGLAVDPQVIEDHGPHKGLLLPQHTEDRAVDQSEPEFKPHRLRA